MDLDAFIRSAIREDIGAGDHTTLACVSPNAIRTAKLVAKEAGVLAGVEVAKKIFLVFDDSLEFEVFHEDGTTLKVGDLVFVVKGKAQSILTAERLALNCIQRMSGIATMTSLFVKEVEGYPAKVLDTRKTTPLFRFFEKLAVKIGGGENHRFGLYDMVMIKDNHIAYAGGVAAAIESTQAYLKQHELDIKIEIEASSVDMVKDILTVGKVHRIMLDNFTFDEVKEALALIDDQYETEVSGNVNLQTIREYAATGVDYISVGALTHSYKSLDLSLQAEE